MGAMGIRMNGIGRLNSWCASNLATVACGVSIRIGWVSTLERGASGRLATIAVLMRDRLGGAAKGKSAAAFLACRRALWWRLA